MDVNEKLTITSSMFSIDLSIHSKKECMEFLECMERSLLNMDDVMVNFSLTRH